MRELIIDESYFTVIMVLEEGTPVYIRTKKSKRDVIAGDIYIARISKVSKDQKIIFLELDRGKNAFLQPLSIKFLNEGKKYKEGDLIIVEVLKESTGSKGPKVTDDWSLARGSLVLRRGKGKSYSKNLLKGDIEKLDKYLPFANDFNCLYRSSIVNEDLDKILEDFSQLEKDFRKIVNNENTYLSPELIYRREDDLLKTIDFFKGDFIQVVTNSYQVKKTIEDNRDIKVSYIEESPLDKFNLRGQIENLRSRKVTLHNKANIVIDKTEAMITVDINGSRGIVKGKREARNINLEALEELARQMELRNLSGIILVDFIDMEDERLKEEVYLRAREIFKKQSVRTTPYPLSKLSIMEIARRREGYPIDETLFSNKGQGKIPYSFEYLIDLIDNRIRDLYLEVNVGSNGELESFSKDKEKNIEKNHRAIHLDIRLNPSYESGLMTQTIEKISSYYKGLTYELTYDNKVESYKINQGLKGFGR